MEDNDQISSGALDRLDNLERIVKRFKITVAGNGNVIGGFGKFFKPPEELTPQQRLDNIKRAVNLMNFEGNNVDVAGNFDDGFRFS